MNVVKDKIVSTDVWMRECWKELEWMKEMNDCNDDDDSREKEKEIIEQQIARDLAVLGMKRLRELNRSTCWDMDKKVFAAKTKRRRNADDSMMTSSVLTMFSKLGQIYLPLPLLLLTDWVIATEETHDEEHDHFISLKSYQR